ncbi:MAG: tetratricopeptide repeat protein [Thermoanaerobaculia bacterium]|nr:tetratricopeptide repeat protein [Thermoanaerobaculia bacterium]
MILMAVGGVAAAIVIAASVVLWISSRKSGSNELLAEALRVDGAAVVATGANPADPARPTFASESARRARAKELFTELDSRYGGSKTGRVAKLYLAQIAVAENDKEKAKQLWQAFLDAEPAGALQATARVNLYKLEREQGRGAQLAEELKKMLEQADKPLPTDVILFELGLTYEALGQGDDARAAYRRIVDEYPQSPYIADAQREAGTAPAGT